MDFFSVLWNAWLYGNRVQFIPVFASLALVIYTSYALIDLNRGNKKENDRNKKHDLGEHGYCSLHFDIFIRRLFSFFRKIDK